MLPFDADVLASLVAQYNGAWFPAPVVALLLGLAVVGLAWRPGGGRAAALILAVGWAWSGITFHLGSFAELNFMAPTYAGAFLVQALVLAWLGLRRRLDIGPPVDATGRIGLGLALVALLAWPLLSLTSAYGLLAAEVAGTAPDPTALLTLGVLLMVRGRIRWLAAVIPAVWTLVGGATAWVLGSEVQALQMLAGPLAIALIFQRNRGAPE